MTRLKELRKEKKLTQSDVAKHLGISIQAYSHYELGTAEPTIDNLIKLAKYYDVSVDYLIGANDIKINPDISKLFKNIKPEMYSLVIKLLENLQDKK